MPNYPVALTWLGSVLILCYPSAPAQNTDPQRLFQQAVAAQQRGDNAAAADTYQKLLRMHPEAVFVRVNLGATLVDLGRFREAIEQYRIVLSADPANLMARRNLALAYRGDNNWSNAIRELEQLHREDAGDQQTALLLGDCLVQGSRYADAINLLAPLEREQPGNADVEWLLGSAMIHTGQAAQGVAYAEKAGETGSNADAYLLAGQTRLAMSQYDLAQQDAEHAKRLNPSLGGLSTLAGMILEQQGDYDAAETALKKGLEDNANDFNAHLYLGSIANFKRDRAQAELHLKRALQLQPTSEQARYQLALLARNNGNLDVALHYLEDLVRQSPQWLQPHVELAALYYRLHRTEDGAREKRTVDQLMAAQQNNLAQTPP